MNKRKITKLNNLNFKPFDKYGKPIKGWSWHKISFDDKKFWDLYFKIRTWNKTLPHIILDMKSF